ncbi:hypothetical protein O1611_g6393 [Lasiodiplodia mahajangana]|uniref:Uncharacterized protein n=1 Tax=Lasiodiplodia mahajangana TaxID=1108764 RepID=A0ACC2JIW5_9PEZI|nr:hypothetical protein O1611_g6393 [Lasiodiplodia mahajangana]
MAGSLPVNLDEWKLPTEILLNETRHPFSASSIEIWTRDKEKLGRGGFGEVWKETTNSTLGENRAQVRAVKRIQKTEKSTPELQNLVRLSTKEYNGPDHLQHFVEFYGWFEDPHHIYISMEYISHHDLQHHIEQRHENGEGFEESEGALIVAEISKALKFMHDSSVVHRDLKPANVLIHKPAPEWKIKLADFGISKDIKVRNSSRQFRLPELRTKAGTDGYMAPEVADTNREKPYTNAVDIWSLGAVTYCIHTGKPPFPDIWAVARYIDRKGVFPLDPLMNFSGKLVIFILQLMEVASDRRPNINKVLEHEWLKPGGKIYKLDPGEWSREASGEWEESSEASVEELKNSILPEGPSRPSSPSVPSYIATDTPQPPPSPSRKPLNSLLKIPHAAPNHPGIVAEGYMATPPLRPSSSPAGDVERDFPPALVMDSKATTYMAESFRRLHNIDHKDSTSQAHLMAQPKLDQPGKAPEKPPLVRYGDSGYSTASASSVPPHHKDEDIPPQTEPIKTPEESPRLYEGWDQFLKVAQNLSQAPAKPPVIPEESRVRVHTDEHHINISSGTKLPQAEHIPLIDFGDSNTPSVNNPPSGGIAEPPVYGPLLPHQLDLLGHNPWRN